MITNPQTYLTYERQRRVNMLRAIIPPFLGTSAVIFTIVGVIAFTKATQVAALYSIELLLLGVIIVLIVSAIALRQGRRSLAISLVTIISAGGTTSAGAVLGLLRGLDAFGLVALTPFSVVIVLAGVLGNRWSVIAATIALNAVSIALLLLVPRAADAVDITNNLPLIVPITVSYQWLFALLMMVIERAFRTTIQELGTAFEQIQQLDTLKDGFIASVNHELRTPLMAMQTILATLRDSDADLTGEQRRYWLNRACTQGDDLADLVKSILSARRVDQEVAHIVPEVVNVRQILDAAIASIDSREIKGEQRALRVSMPADLTVWAGRLELRQILTNLLTNAIKYSGHDSSIEIQAQPQTLVQRAKTQPMVEIIVRDWGLGIPQDQAHLLFNRFTRLPRDLASQVIGNGLGLYLCRVYAEAMGGRIWVESSGVEGEGSTFHVTLPVPVAQEAAIA